MQDMTVAQAAARWGVTVRQVQRLLVTGRVADAQKRGRDWLIPAGSDKPADLRQKPAPRPPAEPDLSAQLAAMLTLCQHPLPWAVTDPIMQLPGDGKPRFFTPATYYRGDFEQCVRNFHAARGNTALRLCASASAMPAAIHMGDWASLREVEQYLAGIVASDASPDVRAYAELALATSCVAAFVSDRAPQWLRDGDVRVLPAPARIDGLYARALYFASIKQWQSMLAVAQTALAMIAPHPGFLHIEVLLRLQCATSLSITGHKAAAERYLLDVLRSCLPPGYCAPILSVVNLFDDDLLETCLRRQFPRHCDAILKQGIRINANWLAFHNRLTRENITQILSPRDYKIARCAAQGLTYQQTAQKFHLSAGTVKNRMQAIYQRLGIAGTHRRQQLAAQIITP